LKYIEMLQYIHAFNKSETDMATKKE